MQCLSLSFSYFHGSFINQSINNKRKIFPPFLLIIEICFYALVYVQFVHTMFLFIHMTFIEYVLKILLPVPNLVTNAFSCLNEIL